MNFNPLMSGARWLGHGARNVGNVMWNPLKMAESTGDELDGLIGGNIAGSRSGLINSAGRGIVSGLQNPQVQTFANILARGLAGPNNTFVNQLTGATDAANQRNSIAQFYREMAREEDKRWKELIAALGPQPQPTTTQPQTQSGVLGDPGTIFGSDYSGVHPSWHPQQPPNRFNFGGSGSNPGISSALRGFGSVNPFQAGADAAPSQPAAQTPPTIPFVPPQPQTTRMQPAEVPAQQPQFNPLADPSAQYLAALQGAAQNPFVPRLPENLNYGALVGLTPEHIEQAIQSQMKAAQINDSRVGDVMTLQQNQIANQQRQRQLEQQAELQELKLQFEEEKRRLQREHEIALEQERQRGRMALSAQNNESRESIARIQDGGNRYRAELSAKSRQAAANIGLSDAALRLEAIRFLNGQSPSYGMGGKEVKIAITNAAAELDPNADIPLNKAEYDADRSALTQMTKNYNNIKSFEKTTQKNLDVLLETLGNLPDTGNQWINHYVRSLSAVMGGEAVPLFNAARRIDVTELARIVNTANANGILSDSAREEINELIPQNATANQIKSLAALLRRDMNNRITSLEEQIAEAKKNIAARTTRLPARSTSGGAAPAQTQAPVEKWIRGSDGVLRKVQ